MSYQPFILGAERLFTTSRSDSLFTALMATDTTSYSGPTRTDGSRWYRPWANHADVSISVQTWEAGHPVDEHKGETGSETNIPETASTKPARRNTIYSRLVKSIWSEPEKKG